MRFTTFIVVMLFGVAFVYAESNEFATQKANQEQIELLRSVLHVDRKEIVAQNMQLSSAEGQAFWPVYHSYRVATNRVKERFQGLVSVYIKLYGSDALTDKNASKILDDLLSFQQELVLVKISYLKRFKKVLPAIKVARFYQIDNRLDTFDLLKISQTIPLVDSVNL